jgi:hypothetical protein
MRILTVSACFRGFPADDDGVAAVILLFFGAYLLTGTGTIMSLGGGRGSYEAG